MKIFTPKINVLLPLYSFFNGLKNCRKLHSLPLFPYLFLFSAFLFLPEVLKAQQEPQFTKYMFNTLVYNPGYAGSKEYLSVTAIYRDQWFGWGDGATTNGGYDGRPVTQSLTIHTPLNKQVGVGLSLVNDRVGSRSTTSLDLSYAYRIAFGEGTLALGLHAGTIFWRADWETLDFRDPRSFDMAFDGENPQLWLPNFGMGFYYYLPQFYLGVSVPHLVSFDLRDVTNAEQDEIRKWARLYQHFYLTAGGAILLNGEDLVFKPSFLLKSVGLLGEFLEKGDQVKNIGAPTTFEIDVSLFFFQKLWVGTSFRSAFAAFSQENDPITQGIRTKSSHSSINAWLAFHFDKGLRIGLAYDYPITEINNYTYGSFELMMGYDFDFKVNRMETPRYFY